jgi:hypothetical protein
MCMLRPLPQHHHSPVMMIRSTGTHTTLRLARKQPPPPLNTRPWSSLHRLPLPLPLPLPLSQPLLLPQLLPLLPLPPQLGPQTPVCPSQTPPARSSSRFTCGQKIHSRRSASNNRMLISKHVFRIVLSRIAPPPFCSHNTAAVALDCGCCRENSGSHIGNKGKDAFKRLRRNSLRLFLPRFRI